MTLYKKCVIDEKAHTHVTNKRKRVDRQTRTANERERERERERRGERGREMNKLGY